MSDNEFPMWAITQNPSDMPGKFVARKHMVGKGYHYATEDHLTADLFDDLQNQMLSKGLSKINRHPQDDPVIVETWI